MLLSPPYNAAMMAISPAWQRLRRLDPLVPDTVLAVVLVISARAEAGSGYMLPILVTAIPLIWRRRYPLPVFALVLLGATGAGSLAPYSVVAAAMIATYSVGAYSQNRVLSLAIILAAATVVLQRFGGALPPVPNWAGPYILIVPLWLVGSAIRNWKLRVLALQERAVRLEHEQEVTTREAVTAERHRITRELHDVVAHNVSVMVIQAGAARQVLSTSPEQSREALLAVESSGREAMAELRNLLGLLSHDGSDVSLAPQPGLDQLEPLLQRVSEAGLTVTLRVEGEPRPLPVGVDLAAYRIVQEGLTNALKYSGLAHTEVMLDYREAEIKVEILDDGCAEQQRGVGEQGRGLLGMRERVALYGGRLEAGPRLERGYAVRAWIPLEATEP